MQNPHPTLGRPQPVGRLGPWLVPDIGLGSQGSARLVRWGLTIGLSPLTGGPAEAGLALGQFVTIAI